MPDALAGRSRVVALRGEAGAGKSARGAGACHLHYLFERVLDWRVATAVAIESEMELAQRSSAGLDVTLRWVQRGGAGDVLLCVCDRREGAHFEVRAEPYLGRDVYSHPFAHRDFSAVDFEDSRFAAQSAPLGCRVPGMAGMIDKVKRWFSRSESIVKEEAEGGEPVATPPAGLGEDERETSTNAQTAGASDEPRSGND